MNLEINWQKMQGLVPAIVQDTRSGKVLMLAYMNAEALSQTLKTKKITFYSRSKKSLWVKGETSGNYLQLVDIKMDCDQDALLVLAQPVGPTCHLGSISCFGNELLTSAEVIMKLQNIIDDRYRHRPEKSYVAELAEQGVKRVAQKVGEEGVEVALAAMTEDDDEFYNEIADLIFHLFILLRVKNLDFSAVTSILQQRMNKKNP